MKTFLLTLTLSLSITTTLPALAHEGHNQAPGTLKAMHGGIPKAGKLFNMEMLAQDKKVLFYPIPHANETVDTAKLKLSGTAKTPKGKATPLNFTLQDKAFASEVNFEGSHRINLEIKAELDGKTDIFKFLVEK